MCFSFWSSSQFRIRRVLGRGSILMQTSGHPCRFLELTKWGTGASLLFLRIDWIMGSSLAHYCWQSRVTPGICCSPNHQAKGWSSIVVIADGKSELGQAGANRNKAGASPGSTHRSVVDGTSPTGSRKGFIVPLSGACCSQRFFPVTWLINVLVRETRLGWGSIWPAVWWFWGISICLLAWMPCGPKTAYFPIDFLFLVTRSIITVSNPIIKMTAARKLFSKSIQRTWEEDVHSTLPNG